MKSTIIFSLLATIASAAVFSSTTFNDLSIAGGTAGNAKEEALAALGGLPTDLTTVAQSDLDVCSSSFLPALILELRVWVYKPRMAVTHSQGVRPTQSVSSD